MPHPPTRIDESPIAMAVREPHIKARTGGSDDHGLFNIGRTLTEFPADANTVPAILDCIRTARCRPGGEAGSSLKLAHNFFGIGIKYYRDRIDTAAPAPASSTRSLVFKALVGEGRNGDTRPIRRRDAIRAVVKSKARGLGRKLARPFRKPVEKTGSALLLELFLDSCGKHLGVSTALKSAVASGRAALGEHSAMFDFMSAVNRDIAGGIAGSVARSIETGELTGIFDAVSAVVAHQFLQMPYYFALFHQNQERLLLPRITGFGSGRPFRRASRPCGGALKPPHHPNHTLHRVDARIAVISMVVRIRQVKKLHLGHQINIRRKRRREPDPAFKRVVQMAAVHRQVVAGPHLPATDGEIERRWADVQHVVPQTQRHPARPTVAVALAEFVPADVEGDRQVVQDVIPDARSGAAHRDVPVGDVGKTGGRPLEIPALLVDERNEIIRLRDRLGGNVEVQQVIRGAGLPPDEEENNHQHGEWHPPVPEF
jgi:hypothetical protein